MYSKGLMTNIASKLRHLFPNIYLDEKIFLNYSDISNQSEEAKKWKIDSH